MLRTVILRRCFIVPRVFNSHTIRNFHATSKKFHSQIKTQNENPFLYSNDTDTLYKRIDKVLLSDNEISNELVLSAIKECQALQKIVYDYDKFWQDPTNRSINEKIGEILKNDNVKYNKELLKQILLLKLPISTDIKVIEIFYERNPKEFIDRSIALIPFRNCLLNGDLKNGLKVIDLTVGHVNYITSKENELRLGLIKLVSTAAAITFFSKIGVNEIIELGYLSSSWKHLGSINSMILTYFLNSSFFVTIVKFGRTLSLSGGDYLTWQKGTFYTHWFKHSDEMLMCSKLMEADFQLNNNSENSPELIEELCRSDDNVSGGGSVLKPGINKDGKKIRLLEAKDNLEDLKLQAYWMSGGDGFEWVEPDQDPATLLWKQRLDKFNKLGIDNKNSKQLKWAEELITDEKTN